MAVPKRFKFKSKKINKINNNQIFTNLLKNKSLLNYLRKKKDLKLLFWLKFFSIFFILLLFYFNLFLNNLMTLLIIGEMLIITLFFIYVFNCLIFNINWIFGFSFIILILGGLEISLSFLLLNL